MSYSQYVSRPISIGERSQGPKRSRDDPSLTPIPGDRMDTGRPPPTRPKTGAVSGANKRQGQRPLMGTTSHRSSYCLSKKHTFNSLTCKELCV